MLCIFFNMDVFDAVLHDCKVFWMIGKLVLLRWAGNQVSWNKL